MEFKKKISKKKTMAMILGIIAVSKVGYEAFDKTSMMLDLINLKKAQKERLLNKQNEENNKEDYYMQTDDSKRFALVGSGETVLEEKYENDYLIKDNNLYITPNKGNTWLKVTDEVEPGCSNIKNYLNEITETNIYISNERVFLVYGGRGSDNITVLDGDIQGNVWSGSTLGLTATRNHNEGYDKMYIDFVENEEIGYMLITKGNEKIVYRSVNSGVTWDNVTSFNEESKEIINHFKLENE